MKIYKHSTYSYVTIVEIPKTEIQTIDMDLCAQPRQTLKKYYDACSVKPTILCNGGFFNMSDGTTCFNYTDDGKIINSTSSYKEGMGINGNDRDNLLFGEIDKAIYYDFVSAYPVLVKNGKKVAITYATEINYKARRTVLAYDENNIFVIGVDAPGLDFNQLQTILVNMGIDYAINLDGGGSTKILHNGTSLTSTAYNRAVDNVIAFYLKPNTIYRVQVGAYSKKANADTMLQKIKSLNDSIGAGYKNAYVRKIGSYYKVQVGAFSKKTNATKVLNDLKSKGFSAFITTN